MSRSRHMPPPREQFALFDATMPLRNEGAVDELPESVQELVDVIGLEATIDLVKWAGGNELKVPEVVDGTSQVWAQLVEHVGREAAVKLVDRYSGTPLYVAKCEAALRVARDRSVVQRLRAGEDFDDVRRSINVTRRHMFRLLAAHRKGGQHRP